ncbi:MAG: hypothetical protein EWV53_20745 [Microcystis panniformis Mp_MB_F_20051200_S9]|uniref:Uncharacterized protein n=1 Tax=Microcystis panniformis Mp_MB_F_20051200_S9 TaxID=2486223 RepID=A0A552PKK8_9CHRO|nr:MAG: hypothetical protein EWV87_22930 [Microcystis panniformis Mp_GB_SS_20050300_S99]TRV46652.1 MAG: hypothetical protein EWV43_14455 [Microcystis panniformis Mp_MB_F_20080800_S26D]TRV49320.1 MAG: hypothetical protein EWV42_13180 [Microcystis panniformis Mp_GB_SS_20050300_S99D]TRV57495.1 MAG: hypothetical protein EWV53_20745 [Microcystis panniformis Mp_MB_F_20051200_S9]TRV65009.1 MAG: hypothetical protein EWV69_00380 [Microcystis panniformis Mp_MB_F_20080800_S26]TRV69513.1 MAG: hypothetical
MNNFYLSLSNIGLGVSYQLSVIRCEFLVYCLLKKLPTPYIPHPTPHTPHLTPHTSLYFNLTAIIAKL